MNHHAKRGRLRFLTACFALCLPALASPQDAAPAAPTEPAPLPVPAISGAADALVDRLRAIDAKLETEPSVATIRAALPAAAEQLAVRATDADIRLADTRSLNDLGELEKSWLDLEVERGAWRETLTARALEVEGELTEVIRLQAVWARTRDRTRDAPDAVLERIAQMLPALESTRARAEQSRDEILTLQSRSAAQESAIASVLARIAQKRSELHSRLLVADSPSLWQAFGSARADEPLMLRVPDVLRENVATLREFAPERGSLLLGHLAMLALLVCLTLYFRPQVRAWAEEDAELHSMAELFGRPLSMSLLIALLVTPWLYARAPGVVTDVAGVLLLVPILRLVPALLPAVVHPLFYALAVMYLVDGFRNLIQTLPLVERGLFAIETAVGVVGLLWLLRPSRFSDGANASGWLRALGFMGRLATLIFSASLLANLLGYVALSRLLGDGVLGSAYLGIVLYAGVVAVVSLFRAILRVRPARLLHLVRKHRPAIVRRARSLAHTVAFLGWAYGSLSFFALDEAVLGALRTALVSELSVGSLAISLGDLLAFGLTAGAALLLARGLRSVLEEEVVPRVSLPRGVGYAIAASVQYSVALLGFFFAVAAAGIDMSRFALIAGAFGVGLGFGLQNVVNNFVSGIILLFERPVRVGDTVETEALLGDVRRIGIRSSTIRTWQGSEVIVPNSALISERVVNWTMSDRQKRIDIAVGVEYGTDPERVLEILTEVGKQHSDVLTLPAPIALFRGFGDSSLDFELRAWTARFESHAKVESDLAVGINRALADAEITIPFPQRDLHVMSVTEQAAGALGPRSKADEPR